jgi:hypothetical protein
MLIIRVGSCAYLRPCVILITPPEVI